MKRKKIIYIFCIILLLLAACSSNPKLAASTNNKQNTPLWVTDKEAAFPDRDWLAVTGKGNTVTQAEDFVISRLSQQFSVDIYTRMSYHELVNESMTYTGKGNDSDFERVTRNINNVYRTTSTKGIIGLIVENWTDPKTNEVHAIARMNRYDCGRRYSEIIDENERIIMDILAKSNYGDLIERIKNISFAHSLALMTDDLHNMRTVLHPMYINYTLEYGNANTILAKAMELKNELIIYVEVTGDENDRLLRTFTSILNKQGYRIEQSNTGNYALIVSLEVIDLATSNSPYQSVRFTLNYTLLDNNGIEIFSNTHSDAVRHNTIEQARQAVIRVVEDWINSQEFTRNFDNFIGEK